MTTESVLEKLIIVFSGAIASGVVSYIIAGMRASVISAQEAGRQKAEIEHLKRTIDAHYEVAHKRMNEISQTMTQTLEKLDARTIEILEKHAELRGIILAKKGE